MSPLPAVRRLALGSAGLVLVTLPVAIPVPAVPAAASPAAAATSATAAPCATKNLGLFLGGRSRTAGSSYYHLRFKNFGASSCTLTGYPGVSAITRSGHRLGSPAGRDRRYAPKRVTLQPHESARTTIRVVNVSNYPKSRCHPTRAWGLRVFPPNQKKSVAMHFPIRACAKPGVRYMSVRAVRRA